jgi:hypothetical protein
LCGWQYILLHLRCGAASVTVEYFSDPPQANLISDTCVTIRVCV